MLYVMTAIVGMSTGIILSRTHNYYWIFVTLSVLAFGQTSMQTMLLFMIYIAALIVGYVGDYFVRPHSPVLSKEQALYNKRTKQLNTWPFKHTYECPDCHLRFVLGDNSMPIIHYDYGIRPYVKLHCPNCGELNVYCKPLHHW